MLLERRGKGKSVLLDSIAYALAKDNFAKKSKKFYNEFEPSIKNLMVLPFHKISDLYIIIKPLSQKLFQWKFRDKLIEFQKNIFSLLDNNPKVSISDVLKERDAIKQEQTIYPERGFNIADNLHQLVILE